MNISKPLCSICCLSYNHAKFIEETIQSIWEQTYCNIEIIALDDGSSDNSFQILERLKENSAIPMHIFQQNNSGNIAKNLNKLSSFASGKYVLFIACDDKLTVNAIESKVAILIKNDNMAFVASRKSYEIDNESNIISSTVLDRLDDTIIAAKDLIELEYSTLNAFYIQCAVFRKDIIDKINGYDEDLLGDDIVLRTKLFLYMQKNHNLTFKFTDDFGFYYRQHDNNIHKNIIRQIKTIAQVLERYFPDRQIPFMLKEWIGHGINTMSFAQTIQMFNFNQKLLDLLQDDYILACFAQSYNIDKNLLISQDLFTRLILLKSKKKIEKESITVSIENNNTFQEVVFPLNHIIDFENFNFQPVNRACVIEILNIYILYNEKSIDLSKKMLSNAIITDYPYFYFETNSPIITFQNISLKQIDSFHIKFKIHNLGNEVNKSIIDWQKNKLESIEQSKAWKLVTMLRRFKQIPKIGLIYTKFYLKRLYTQLIVFFDRGKNYEDRLLQNQANAKQSNSKLVIFSHYNKNNMIDDYVIHYLSEIKKLDADIILVSTAEGLSEAELHKVSTLCKQVVVKKNIGYDFGAWRTGISLVVDDLAKYEQLILCNDSVYAPLYDLNNMFDTMQNKHDFWGITDNYQHGHHIQSYFMVFSKEIFLQDYFLNFWQNIRVFKHKESIIQNYEIGLTKLLKSKKHSYSAYCPSGYKSKKNSTHHEWKKLIVDQKCPIIKVELLRDNPTKTDISDWESVLTKYTDYDPTLIKDHLRRLKQS